MFLAGQSTYCKDADPFKLFPTKTPTGVFHTELDKLLCRASLGGKKMYKTTLFHNEQLHI